MRQCVRSWIAVAAICAILIAWGGLAAAQEHPAGSSSEHPTEHPAAHTEKPKQAVSMEELSQAITRHVESESAKKGGQFVVHDAVQDKSLSLKLDKIHKDRLARVHDGIYFACADFKTSDGTVYDLDVFMKGPDAQHLETTEVTVHKKDGKPRYNWKEQDGAWAKVPLEK